MAKKTISMRRESHEESAAIIEEIQVTEQTEEAAAEPAAIAETATPKQNDKKPAAGVFGDAMKRGIILENPVLRLVLGTCPTLATSTSMVNALVV